MDLKIGCLHAYPSGELQFENNRPAALEEDDVDDEVAAINNRRYMARRLRGRKDEAEISEQNLEHVARAMS